MRYLMISTFLNVAHIWLCLVQSKVLIWNIFYDILNQTKFMIIYNVIGLFFVSSKCSSGCLLPAHRFSSSLKVVVKLKELYLCLHCFANDFLLFGCATTATESFIHFIKIPFKFQLHSFWNAITLEC